MPEPAGQANVETTTAPASPAVTQSAPAPQNAPAPDDPLAKLTARLDQFEAMSKELHAERTTAGRLKAQLKVATAENTDRFIAAYSRFDEERALLLEQGYSERVIDALAASDPEALREMAAQARKPAKGVPASDELAALRAEIQALKQGGAGAQPPPTPTPTPIRSVFDNMPQGQRPPARTLPDLINRYADGEALSTAEREQLNGHLKGLGLKR